MNARSWLARALSIASVLAMMLLWSPLRYAVQAQAAEAKPTATEVIMPHITDSKDFEYPCVKSWRQWTCEAELPVWNVQIGSHTVDMGPTKHVVWLGTAAILALVIL